MGKKANKRKPPQRYRPQKQQVEQSPASGESPAPAVDGESKEEGEEQVEAEEGTARSKSRHFGRGELDKASDLCPECSTKRQAGKKQKQLRKKNMETSFEGVCSACKSKKGSKLRDDQPVSFQSQEGKNGVVRGLMNLGNTCFFNSVMQNLLAVKHLKDYFLSSVSVSEGPLSSALRRFFQELNAEPSEQENSTKKRWKDSGTYNPKGLFGAVCAKSARFSSYQQQDSHELLRCLLDGLHVEEESVRRKGEDEKSEDNSSSFIDRFFGGQFASTVKCCVCGHSSSVLEPFLDISLPIPTQSRKISTSTNKASTATSRSSTTTNLSKREIKARKILDRRKRSSVVKVAATNNTMRGEAEVEDFSWLDFVDVSADQMTEITNPEQDYVSAALTGAWGIDGEAANSSSVVVRDGWETLDLTAESSAASTVVPGAPELAELVPAAVVLPNESEDKVAPEPNSYSTVVPDGSQSNAAISDGWEGAESYISPPDGGIVYGPEPFNPATDDVLSTVNCSTSGVICLPYKEETQAAESSQQGWEVLPDSGDVDGIADLFHEEEEYSEPATGVMIGCANRQDAVGGFEEEFEPLEEVVEESIAPMTLEGCLSAFTKLEVLSGENAWDCEKCSSKQGGKSTEGVDSSTTSSSNDAEDDTDSFAEGGISEQATPAENGPGDACSIQAEGTKRTARGRGKAQKKKNDNTASVGRKATKSLVIRKAPPVLTVHLKRFAQDMRGRLSKLAGHVAFEELLNLEPFQGTKGTEPCVYRLVGVVEHSGTMRGGHYVAFVRAGDSEDSKDSHWYHISDSHVRRTTLDQVLRSEAYLLFYERVGVPA